MSSYGGAGIPTLGSNAFGRAAGWCAIAAAVLGLGYSVAFVILKAPILYSLLLLGGALVTSVAIVAFADRLRAVDPGFATWGMVLGLAGALGAGVHGAYDLANALHPPAEVAGLADYPNAIDPRGFLTFGIAGLGLVVLAWLATRDPGWPRALALLGLGTGALLVVVYLARLIVLDASSPLVLGPAAIAGLVANPLFYAWLGRELLRAT